MAQAQAPINSLTTFGRRRNDYSRRTVVSLRYELGSRGYRRTVTKKRQHEFIRAARVNKADYINKLLRLDKQGPRLTGPFRFLELPPGK